MSLSAVYQRFLASPQASYLADNASLYYVPTLTSIHDVSKILRHLTGTHLKKRDEKVIDVVEGPTNVALEVETTIEFLTSGGAYLPGLDDNFLADRVVTLPITHFVNFDATQKIQQIRLSWDQGSLLKNLEVIGARGRNWPIQDGIDQARLIKSGVALAAKATAPASAPPPALRSQVSSKGGASNGNSKNVTRDPHASLALFGPRDSNDESSQPAAVATRASAKPPPRDYHDLFVGNDSDASPASTIKGPKSPKKASYDEAVAPKGGAGKNYLPSRLFDEEEGAPEAAQTPLTIGAGKHYHASRLFEEDEAPQASPTGHAAEHFYKANPKKYHHFDFADGSEEQDKPKPSPARPKSKHDSQWDFEDFVTPSKPVTKVRGQDVRHFGWSDDEVNADSPIKQKRVDKPRRDAETHFEFQDDGTPEGEKRPTGVPRGTSHNNGLGLYENNLYNEDGTVPASPPKRQQPLPLGNVTNINNHRKVFDSQFSILDDSPASKDAAAEKPVTHNRQQAVKMMDSNWSAYDESPETQDKKENVAGGDSRPRKTGTGIMTAGDGMGGRKGTGRQWGFGDDSDGEGADGVNGATYRKGVPGKKQHQGPANNPLWDT
ncbi:MAG: hypothetical protein M1838_005014 [Thelocarpon superellum]|nr:MAG: hypothetical protein M1838_005014 [Thelocarpon superellum]